MPTRRQEQAADQIQRELSDLLLRSTNDPRIKFASITTVHVSADLRHAKVYVSIFGDQAAQKETMYAIHHASGYLKRELSSRLSFKFMPDLVFLHDESIERGDRMLRLIEQVRAEDRTHENVEE